VKDVKAVKRPNSRVIRNNKVNGEKTTYPPQDSLRILEDRQLVRKVPQSQANRDAIKYFRAKWQEFSRSPYKLYWRRTLFPQFVSSRDS
jgi:hypothetical protein